jgi:hypothetical protein
MTAFGEIRSNQIEISTIHTNTELTLIQITEDKLRLELLGHLSRVEKKNRWQIPLGVLLALVPVVLTSEFKDVIGVSSATWRAFFMFAIAGSFFWLAVSIPRVWQPATLDGLVERIKNVAHSAT